MAATAKPFTFGYHLRKTTRNPIFLPPLSWNSNHLILLRISFACFENKSPGYLQQIKSENVPCTPVRPKNLPTGYINQDYLRTYWSWAGRGKEVADEWIPIMIVRLIDSIHQDLEADVFIHQYQEYTETSPKLTFKFANTSTNLQLKFLLFTSKTHIPFLIYSNAHHRNSLRQGKADRLRETSQSWKVLNEVASTHFEIDPFDVACLIAMAQHQAARFRSSYLAEVPTHFKVYLVTPNHFTSDSFYIYTAKIARAYLDALEDVDLEVEEGFTISREVIEVPSQKLPFKIDKGIMVQRFGEIFEEVSVHHAAMKALQDEKDLHDRKFSRIQAFRARREKNILSSFGVVGL